MSLVSLSSAAWATACQLGPAGDGGQVAFLDQHFQRGDRGRGVRRLDEGVADRGNRLEAGLVPIVAGTPGVLEKSNQGGQIGHLLDGCPAHAGVGIAPRDLEQHVARVRGQVAHGADPDRRVVTLPGRLRAQSFEQLHDSDRWTDFRGLCILGTGFVAGSRIPKKPAHTRSAPEALVTRAHSGSRLLDPESQILEPLRGRKQSQGASPMSYRTLAGILGMAGIMTTGTLGASAQQNPVVVMETTRGSISIELLPDAAPITVENFLQYANDGFFEGTVFHRVIPGFMIQGGGLRSDLTEKTTRAPIRNEADNGLSNERGTISMARTSVVDSATAQFFINTVDNGRSLDHRGTSPRDYGYAVFGRVTAGMDVVDAISGVTTGRQGPHQNVPVEPVVINAVTVQ